MTDGEMIKRVSSLKRKRAELKHLQEELLEDPKVQEYLEVSKSLRDTDSIIRILNQNILKSVQENCEHPVWILLNEDYDSWEGRLYFTCRCVACGKEKTAYARKFPVDRIIYDTSINGLSEKWEKFSQDCLDDSSLTIEKGKTFVKIFNEKH